ncbi:MAG: two-component regulator propeller domain-containing protein [Flavobacteriia bacterium]
MRIFIFFIFLAHGFVAQIGTGQWRLHVPTSKAVDVVAGNGLIYAAYENGLVEYDPEAKEQSLMTSVNSLSDINITCLQYLSSLKTIVVGYENGNIDLLTDNRITNVPAIKLAQIPGSKRINKIVVKDNDVFLATDFSIVKLDPVKKEIRDTWYPTSGNSPIVDLAFRNDSVFALSPFSLYVGDNNNFALADPAQWTLDPRLPASTTGDYKAIETILSELYVVSSDENYGSDSIFKLTQTSAISVLDPTYNVEINSIHENNGQLLMILFDGIWSVDPSTYSVTIVSGGYYQFGGYARPNNAIYSKGSLWVADNSFGLINSTNGVFTPIKLEGPPKREFYSMDWQNGKLAVVGGGLSEISPTFSGSGMYLFEDESWSLRDRDNMNLWNGQNIWDFISVAIHPKDKQTVAVSTFSEIPVSIMKASNQVTDTFTPTNSTLKVSATGGLWSLVSALSYDTEGNLWAVNGYSDQPLNVYTADGNWISFDCGSSAKNKFSRKLAIDYKGNKWFALEGAGLIGYNHNNTLSDPSDDQVVRLNTGATTGALPSDRVTAIAVDFDNKIWIGTDNGFAVLYNSETAFGAESGDYNAQRIKLEFEGNVEYVLGNTGITDIEVDGGNRKWMATANSGIILLSADGLEILEQHTIENSPLISNTILDIELDQNTGELYIITDNGLISYRTDATYEDPEYSSVKVFPNPARPDFQGPITIQGIRYNSDVKITDVAGNLVYKTTSNGGTATWDGKTLTGERVTSGVYLIWSAANEGKGRKVGKVVVIN